MRGTMTKSRDGIPEPVATHEWSKQATTEFCSEQHDGCRCMLLKGHPGMHESLARQGIVSWGDIYL